MLNKWVSAGRIMVDSEVSNYNNIPLNDTSAVDEENAPSQYRFNLNTAVT